MSDCVIPLAHDGGWQGWTGKGKRKRASPWLAHNDETTTKLETIEDTRISSFIKPRQSAVPQFTRLRCRYPGLTDCPRCDLSITHQSQATSRESHLPHRSRYFMHSPVRQTYHHSTQSFRHTWCFPPSSTSFKASSPSSGFQI